MFMEKIIGLIDAPFTPFYANGDVNLELWSDSNIKLELVRSWFLQVYCLLRLRTHWLTQHLNLESI